MSARVHPLLSQRYVRFTPSIIAPLLALPPDAAPPAKELLACVGACADDGAGGAADAWDHDVSPFQLPPGIEVMMADVATGANTPSMVKKVGAPARATPTRAHTHAHAVPTAPSVGTRTHTHARTRCVHGSQRVRLRRTAACTADWEGCSRRARACRVCR